MFSLLKGVGEFIFIYCTDFVINISNLSGLSYYEINTFIFIIVWPLLTMLLGLMFLMQKVRLSRFKRSKTFINKPMHLHYQKS